MKTESMTKEAFLQHYVLNRALSGKMTEVFTNDPEDFGARAVREANGAWQRIREETKRR